MRKFMTVLTLIATIATGVFVAPRGMECFNQFKRYQALSKEVTETKKKMREVESELATYKEKYKDVSIASNHDVARTLATMSGASLLSITSIAEIDGEDVICSEVNSVDDTIFFNSQTKKMVVKLNINNINEFINSLVNSAVSVDKAVFSIDSGIAEITVPTVFDGNTNSGGTNTAGGEGSLNE